MLNAIRGFIVSSVGALVHIAIYQSMRMKPKTAVRAFTGLAVIFLLLMLVIALRGKKQVQRPTLVVADSFRAMFKGDYESYRFRSIPVGNFGVGTVYDISGGLVNNTNASQNPLFSTTDTMFADGVTDVAKKAALFEIIQTGALGRLSLQDVDATKMGLQATAPEVYHALAADGAADVRTGVRIVLRANDAEQHSLAWLPFKRAMASHLIDHDLVARLAGGDVLIVNNDLTLIGYTVHVEVEEQGNAGLQATLRRMVGRAIGSGAGITFSIKQSNASSFDIVANAPVIVAQQFSRLTPARETNVASILNGELPTTRPALAVNEADLRGVELNAIAHRPFR